MVSSALISIIYTNTCSQLAGNGNMRNCCFAFPSSINVRENYLIFLCWRGGTSQFLFLGYFTAKILKAVLIHHMTCLMLSQWINWALTKWRRLLWKLSRRKQILLIFVRSFRKFKMGWIWFGWHHSWWRGHVFTLLTLG